MYKNPAQFMALQLNSLLSATQIAIMLLWLEIHIVHEGPRILRTISVKYSDHEQANEESESIV